MEPITVSGLLERAKATSQDHKPFPYISEFEEVGFQPPHTMVITCADPRCVPEDFFNLHPGEVVVVRNAGGHAKHSLRSILIVDFLMGLHDIIVVHHTDCGTTKFRDEQIRASLKERIPDQAKEIDAMVFGEIANLEDSVREDLAWLRSSPFIKKELAERTHGFIYDIKTGEVNKVE